jgi:hypothetical protein
MCGFGICAELRLKALLGNDFVDLAESSCSHFNFLFWVKMHENR